MSISLKDAFARAAKENRAAFLPFVTGGYPDMERFRGLLGSLCEAGADVIEVGLPYSDPLADGPVIMKTSQVALEGGANPLAILEAVGEEAPGLDAALVVMTYWNPILALGPEKFAARARAAGVAGVIVPDLPAEESEPWLEAARKEGLDTIFLVAPTTTPERLETTLSVSSGFVYYVSLVGVTGAGLQVDDGLLSRLDLLKSLSGLPVAVGFGVSTPEQAGALARSADGVIVGSALMKQMLEGGDPDAGVNAALDLARELRAALNRQ